MTQRLEQQADWPVLERAIRYVHREIAAAVLPREGASTMAWPDVDGGESDDVIRETLIDVMTTWVGFRCDDVWLWCGG